MKGYGERIKKAREAAKMTQEELGAKIGVTGVTIMRYEKNQREPRFEQLLEISYALKVPYLYFFEDAGVFDNLDEARANYLKEEKAAKLYPVIENLLEIMYGRHTRKEVVVDGFTLNYSIFGSGRNAVAISSDVFNSISDAVQGTVTSIVDNLGESPGDVENGFLEDVPKMQEFYQKVMQQQEKDKQPEGKESPEEGETKAQIFGFFKKRRPRRPKKKGTK